MPGWVADKTFDFDLRCSLFDNEISCVLYCAFDRVLSTVSRAEWTNCFCYNRLLATRTYSYRSRISRFTIWHQVFENYPWFCGFLGHPIEVCLYFPILRTPPNPHILFDLRIDAIFPIRSTLYGLPGILVAPSLTKVRPNHYESRQHNEVKQNNTHYRGVGSR